ncbi:tRNA (adenine(22)-N(1))-methyltransferase [Mediterraneibacter sp.]|jgi:tRNA (adenine22-N1)-methyltransferase|uniref:tRNA (adenine(22)-N(1))-methyltransferase n=1 Tax=Mediterraneibacter sp. TaxID=2316022 RepID=UPI0015AD0E99|nr:class I SAM-dependent methyltransferase [Mediterraneibacter sp.]
MELSKRLQAVADLVTAGYKVADIGTDHAYIPIFLLETGKTDWAAAMDVNKGPIEKARENIRAYGLEAQIETRLSNGFLALGKGEVQSAVIAGMGGNLVIRILQEGRDVVSTLQECILQPQSETDKVRAFLLREGFFFIEEDMVEEDGKYYPMMKVKPPKSGEESRQNEEVWKIEQLWFGKLLLEKRHPVLKRYLERETRIREEILRSIRDKDSEQIQVRRGQLQEELNIIKKGMEYYAL